MQNEVKGFQERSLCERVVYCLNQVEGTDYSVEKSMKDPPDLLLVSRAEKFPIRGVEVTTIPGESKFFLREDNTNLTRLRAQLARAIAGGNRSSWYVWVDLTDKALKTKLGNEDIREIGLLISQNLGSDRSELSSLDIWNRSPELSNLVHGLGWFPSKEHGIQIHFQLQSFAGAEDSIAKAIEEKAERYRDKPESRHWILIIGAAWFILQPDVAAFKMRYPVEAIPFNQVWVVTFPGVAIRLKPA